jgi:hypothetical protein
MMNAALPNRTVRRIEIMSPLSREFLLRKVGLSGIDV